MRRQIWIFFSLWAVSAATSSTALACGAAEYYIEEDTLFTPDIIGRPDLKPLFYEPTMPRNGEPGDLVALHLAEWKKHFGGRMPEQAWSDLLRKGDLSQIDHLIFVLKGKESPGPADVPFQRYPDRARLIAALYYLGFAKRVDPFAKVEPADPWRPPPKKPGPNTDPGIQKLIDGAAQAMATTRDPFLRQRYAFQILRLLFFAHRDADALEFYLAHVGEFSEPSAISYRARGYAAGSLARLGRFAEANYLYSRLYADFPALAAPALWSFHPQEEADWARTLQLCKSPAEKEVLWQMLGITRDGPRAIGAIYALDPKSDRLPILLVREIAQVESATGISFLANLPPNKETTERLSSLRKLVAGIADRGDTEQPWLWALAAGHLSALLGDKVAADRFLAKAESLGLPNALARKQLRASRFLAFVKGLKTIAPADELVLADGLAWLKTVQVFSTDGPPPADPFGPRAAVLFSSARRVLAALYRQTGNSVYAACLDDQGDMYADPAKIEALREFLAKRDKSTYQSLLASLYPGSVEQVQELRAIALLFRGGIAEAASLLSGMKTEALPADPFDARIRDCHDCDQAAPHRTYTKAEALRRMADLLAEAQTNPGKAAQNYFLLANALYNLTYYGNCRGFYRVGDIERFVPMDDSLAESYYRKTVELAGDRELQAKAAFMAAKCEHNAWYTAKQRARPAGKWFPVLKERYADTQYYAEILRECGDFRRYAKQQDRGWARRVAARHRP
jgi:hypothetical protein